MSTKKVKNFVRLSRHDKMTMMLTTECTERSSWTPERIRRLRRNLRLTQQEFADLLRVVRQTVVGWEKGYHWPPIGPATVVMELLEGQLALGEMIAKAKRS